MSKPNGEAEHLPEPKVHILVPAHDMCSSLFTVDLTLMYGYTVANLDAAVGLSFNIGTYVHDSRWDLLKVAAEANASYICWIDSDMRFPRDALIRLIEHDKPVVGINYCTRGLPPRYVAIKTIKGGPGSQVETRSDSTGLERVEAVGFGLVVMRGDALQKLKFDGQPLFSFEWMQDRDAWMGEDVYFCQKLKEAGIPVYVDHDLSKECRHVGSFEYATHHVEAWYEDDANGEAKEPLIVMP